MMHSPYFLILFLSICFRCISLKYRALQHGRHQLLNLHATQKSWQVREHEFVINNQESPDTSGFYHTDETTSLFDKKYDSEDDETEDHSLGKLSLTEISDAYQFSLSFLGDFAAQLGCLTPVDIETNIENIMTGEQIFTLLTALNSLDPLDSNAGYDSVSVIELASDMNVSTQKIVEICIGEQIGLPYGVRTVLHLDVVDQIKRVADYDEYNGLEGEEDDEDFILIKDEDIH